MSGWTIHEGQAIALDREGIDTDQLIPARFMSTPRSAGYGGFLLHDLRFDPEGQPIAEFPLNRHPGASVLVTRRNFGGGSSREAAVYALLDFGIRVVVAPSFGDIFSGNAVNNGLLPARVADVDPFIAALGTEAGHARADIASGTLDIAGHRASFHLGETWREKLINGWDDIDLTRARATEIAAFRARYATQAPWAIAPQRDNTD